MEPIVFCDESGRPTGITGPKLSSHHSKTPLHLGFSCYVFSETGELLVTQRASSKKVWPNVWTNTVCGHPLPGESFKDAVKRRLNYELGMIVKDMVIVLPKYRYTTSPYNGIIENEFCPVFFARAASKPNLNPEEVQDSRWMAWSEFLKVTENDVAEPPIWSWWCKDQLLQLLAKKTLLKKYLKG